jgi:hypothetical protein
VKVYLEFPILGENLPALLSISLKKKSDIARAKIRGYPIVSLTNSTKIGATQKVAVSTAIVTIITLSVINLNLL